jgi:uncharacterized protein (TIGR02588 family)
MPERDGNKRDIPFIEKLIAAAGLLLVLLVAGSLGYEAVTHTGSPPDIEVQVDEVVRVDAGYLVRFTAFNSGQTTGAHVRIRGELRKEAHVVEENVAVLSYVPDGGRQEGGLFFERDPRDHNLNLRAIGYEKP